MSLSIVPLLLTPCPPRPGSLDDLGRSAWTHRDELTRPLKALEATRGEELPQVPLVRKGVVVVRAREELPLLMRVGEGMPQVVFFFLRVGTN